MSQGQNINLCAFESSPPSTAPTPGGGVASTTLISSAAAATSGATTTFRGNYGGDLLSWSALSHASPSSGHNRRSVDGTFEKDPLSLSSSKNDGCININGDVNALGGSVIPRHDSRQSSTYAPLIGFINPYTFLGTSNSYCECDVDKVADHLLVNTRKKVEAGPMVDMLDCVVGGDNSHCPANHRQDFQKPIYDRHQPLASAASSAVSAASFTSLDGQIGSNNQELGEISVSVPQILSFTKQNRLRVAPLQVDLSIRSIGAPQSPNHQSISSLKTEEQTN